MSENTNTEEVKSQNTTQAQNATQGFALRGQYIKDLSFENPHAPDSLLPQKSQPEIQLSIDIKVTRMNENFYESSLYISARANGESGTIFLIDLVYAGIFEVHNIPEEKLEQIMLVDCPFILFPFARRVIADVSRDGGFPPLLLEPIDFHGLYTQRQTKAG